MDIDLEKHFTDETENEMTSLVNGVKDELQDIFHDIERRLDPANLDTGFIHGSF